MAARKTTPQAAPRPQRIPDQATRDRLRAEAARGSDSALPARDRRNRARISARTHLAAGTAVDADGEKEVVGPARGDGWALLAWVDDELEGAPCYGTYHESQIRVLS